MTYITPDEFRNSPLGGFDLRDALIGYYYENQSLSAEAFIELVTETLMTFVDVESFRDYHWEKLTPFQMKYWKMALIAQTAYTYREGAKAFGGYSGVDDEKGKVIDLNVLKSVQTCQAAMKFMIRGGIFNLNIKNRRRTWPSGDNYGFF